MGILWSGGEDISFPAGSVVSVDTTAGRFRAGYARCAVYQAGNGLISRGTPFSGGAVTSCWVTARLYAGDFQTTYGGARQFGVGRSGAEGSLWIGALSTDKTKLGLHAWDGAAVTLLASSPGSVFANDALYRLDLQIAGFGETATVRVYLDNVLLFTYTGDLSGLGISDLDSVLLAGVFATGYDSSLHASEIIVSAEDTRLFSLVTLAPNAAGDANTFTAGAYTDINEVAKNDADTAYSDTPGQGLLVGLSDLPEGDFIVKDLAVVARLSDGVGGMGMKLGVKTNGSVVLSDTIALEGAWETKGMSFPINPITDNVFTLAEINALQLAFESAAVA